MLKTLLNLVTMLLQKLKRKPEQVSQKPQLKLVVNPPLKLVTTEDKTMQISKAGLDLICTFEGLKLSPYLDSVNIATIGFGSTFYLDGTRVTMNDKPITKEYALDLLKNVVSMFEKEVQKLIKVSVNQNQYDAIICLVYNIGVGAFSKSTLLRLLNDSKYTEAAEQFLRWDKAGGKPLKGLTNRRVKERELFLK
jgi:lysozyme